MRYFGESKQFALIPLNLMSFCNRRIDFCPQCSLYNTKQNVITITQSFKTFINIFTINKLLISYLFLYFLRTPINPHPTHTPIIPHLINCPTPPIDPITHTHTAPIRQCIQDPINPSPKSPPYVLTPKVKKDFPAKNIHVKL